LLRRWKLTLDTEGQDAFPGHGNLPPAEDELRRLKAEVARLKAERDILKRATALFARESL
jgi:transposase